MDAPQPDLLRSAPYAGRRLAVALSGGVDSALVAALLKDSGADVVALTMLVREEDDARDARALAAFLGLSHEIIDLRAAFRSCVVEPFVESYLCGETPNPCALCNKTMKFGALAQSARNLGAQGLATGHYVRKIDGAHGPELHRGGDFARDQSYFLFALSPEQLAFSLFPLGLLTKEEVRAQARSKGLPVADKKDSQDICFVPDGAYRRVVEALAPGRAVPGEIVDSSGAVIGRHDGIAGFTIGQRKGLGIGAQSEPLYVASLDPLRNEVVVGPKEALWTREVVVRDVNWLAEDMNERELRVLARVRSTQPLVPALFSKDGAQQGRLVFDEPVLGVCPGQAAVFYRQERLLGGGWIVRGA